jgi:hypothetical protein
MIAQRNPRDMHGAKRSGKENFEVPWEDGRRWVKLQKQSPIRSSRRLEPLALNLQRENLLLGSISRSHGWECERKEELGIEKSRVVAGLVGVKWGWIGNIPSGIPLKGWTRGKPVRPVSESDWFPSGNQLNLRSRELKLDLRTNMRDKFQICWDTSSFSEKLVASTLYPKTPFSPWEVIRRKDKKLKEFCSSSF